MNRQAINQLKDAIRHPYAWPGGYPIYPVIDDGELLCCDCAKKEFRQIVHSTKHQLKDGWQAAGATILWEGTEYCAHCSTQLESAYGEEESE